MELEHSFTVPVPVERAWDVLLDVERVAPCMPGASLDSVTGDEIAGRIKVKVGPISMTYAGTARFTERDAATANDSDSRVIEWANPGLVDELVTLLPDDRQSRIESRSACKVTF